MFIEQSKSNFSHQSHNAYGETTKDLQLQQHHYNNLKSPISPT